MLFDVTAATFSHAGVPLGLGARTERIDTETNRLFNGLTTPWEIEDRYEDFWNRLNASWEDDNRERVKVLSVRRINE